MTPSPDAYPQPGDDVPGAPPPLRGRIAPPAVVRDPEPAPRARPALLAVLALVIVLAVAGWVRRRQSLRRSP